jgi:hypothetical protein
MSAALRISVATSGGSVGRLLSAARARVVERPVGAAVGRVRGRVAFVVALRVAGGAASVRGRRFLAGASAHSSRPSSRVQATCRRLVGALRVGSLRCGRPSSVSSRLRVTSRAPRRATFPHCLALVGSGCSSSKVLRLALGRPVVAAPLAGGRRGPRSGRSSRWTDRVTPDLPVLPVPPVFPVLVPVPEPERLRSWRSSPSRPGGRLPPVLRVDDDDRGWESGWLRLRVPEGRPAREEALDDRADGDPLRLPPVRPP